MLPLPIVMQGRRTMNHHDIRIIRNPARPHVRNSGVLESPCPEFRGQRTPINPQWTPILERQRRKVIIQIGDVSPVQVRDRGLVIGDTVWKAVHEFRVKCSIVAPGYGYLVGMGKG